MTVHTRSAWLPRLLATAALGALLVGPFAARPAAAGHDDGRFSLGFFFGFPPVISHGHSHHYHHGYHAPRYYYGPRYGGHFGYSNWGYRGHHYGHGYKHYGGHKHHGHGYGHRHGHGCRH